MKKDQQDENGEEGKKSSIWKGLIGLFVILGLVIGGMIALARYENNARTEEAEKQASESPAPDASFAQCFTLSSDLMFSTGSPKSDAVLAQVIKDNQGTDGLNEFLTRYSETARIDQDNPLWKKALNEVPDGVELKPYLSIDPSQEINTAADASPEDYLEGSLGYPEDVDDGFYRIKIQLTDSKEKKTLDDTQEVVIPLSENSEAGAILFPVGNSEEGNDGFIVTDVAPVC